MDKEIKQKLLDFIKDQKKKHYSSDLIIKHLIGAIKSNEILQADKYSYEVKLSFSGNIEAENEPDALAKLQEEFKQEYGLEPTNDEVELSKD